MKSADLQNDVVLDKPRTFRDSIVSPSMSAVRPPKAAEGVSGFVDLLIRRGIVSREIVMEAVQLKKSRKTDDKRALFLLLIEEFGTDREQVYAEFVKYYSFATIDLASI